jgi:methylated-DNA-protein-cysteine methyltransferase-like protein
MEHSRDPLYARIIDIIRCVPAGRVATYGQIASYAGNCKAARQVARVLHSSSKKENLPWHRIVNGRGLISLKPQRGYELQKSLLEEEGVLFDDDDRIDLKRYQWHPQ